MKKVLTISIILIMMLGLGFCGINNNDATVANAAIFDIPASITGDTSGRALDDTILSNIDLLFFDPAREQIKATDQWAGELRDLIATLENNGVFDYAEVWEGTVNSDEHVKWTPPAAEGDPYLLEYWGSDNKKIFELTFDTYTKDPLHVAGNIIMDYTTQDGWADGNVKMLRIDFDSNSDDNNTKYIKVSASGFKSVETDTEQKGILKAWRNAEGITDVVCSISVNDITYLNYEEVSEDRFYIYSAKGVAENASMALALPQTGYTADNTIFSGADTLGALTKEYVADIVRADTVAITAFESTDPPLLDGNGDYTTQEIYDAVSAYFDTLSETDDRYDEIETWLYVMDCVNAIHFEVSDYVGYGDEGTDYAPATFDNYYNLAELPTFDIAEADVTGLTIAFADASDYVAE